MRKIGATTSPVVDHLKHGAVGAVGSAREKIPIVMKPSWAIEE